MVLTQNQTTAFFTNADQMGIPVDTYNQMANEGVSTVDDLGELGKEGFEQMVKNLRHPPGTVAQPGAQQQAAPAAAAAAVAAPAQAPMHIPTPAFVFGAISQERLKVSCALVKFYNTVGRDLTAANIQWDPVGKNFKHQWNALKGLKDKDAPDIPKITRSLTIMKWTEAFSDFLSRVVGTRTIPLSYVIRSNDTVPANTPPLATNQPHSTEHGSVEAELVARASHTHANFRDDNAQVYYYIEEATRGTSYSASIKPYQRTKNGRASWLALTSQYAGTDKWEAEIKRQEQLLHTRKWKGQSNFSLESFIAQHRNAFVSLQACAEHVTYQLPNEHSRVKLLLDAIENSDAELQAAIAAIKMDSAPTGRLFDFEKAATHLLPSDPVARKRISGNKRNTAAISAVTEEVNSTTAKKPSIGQSGVHLRYHTSTEYKALTKDQKDELREWRANNPSQSKAKKAKADTKSKSNIFTKNKVASLVAKRVDAELKKAAEPDPEEDMETYITSLVDAAVARSTSATAAATTTDPTPQPKKVTLKSILKRAKN